MNDRVQNMSLIVDTPKELLPSFAPFERAFILAVKRFREKEAAAKASRILHQDAYETR